MAMIFSKIQCVWSQELTDCRECSAAIFPCTWPFDPEEKDAYFDEQWYIASIRACEVWNLGQGYTGYGVSAAVIDFGIFEGHEDLISQYNAACSEDRPFPPPPCNTLENFHGTQMAGVFAATANNSNTGIAGIAFGATVGEIFLYDTPWNPPETLETEMELALGFNNNCFAIKMMAYLLNTDQTYYAIPHDMWLAAKVGSRTDRDWLGVKYVIAAGNYADDSNTMLDSRTDYDELVSSRFTMAVGSVRLIDGFEGRHATSRRGASLFCVAPGCDMRVTNARRTGNDPCTHASEYGCTSGSSFATPCVAGVVALMLEANPNLAVRDVMEAIIQTAATIDPGPGWHTNQAGIDHSYEYGHGLIDALEAVSLVTSEDPYPAWTPLLGERQIIVPIATGGVQIGPGEKAVIPVTPVANMRIEHAELAVNITTVGLPGIGPLEIEIDRMWPLSGSEDFGGRPKLTRSVFAVARTDPTPSYESVDPKPAGDGNARFTSVRHWGETGTATWKVRVRNTSDSNDPVTATWNVAELRFYGTPKCIADWDMDGDSDDADDTAYRADHDALEPWADLDGDRDVDEDDLDLWEFVYYPAGCS